MAVSVAASGAGRPQGDGPGGGVRRWLNAPSLAWEFLRRNTEYHADFARWRQERRSPLASIDPRWGLRFAADPNLTAEEAKVFWLPEVAPGLVVWLRREEADGSPGQGRLLPSGQTRRARDGLHLRTAWGLQALIDSDGRGGEPLIVALTYDEHLRLRVRAVDAFERLAAGRPPPKSHLTSAQILRLHRCLEAVDGALAGRSYRAIAQTIFGASAVASAPWKISSARATTIRLVRAGRALIDGGYLKLLHGGL